MLIIIRYLHLQDGVNFLALEKLINRTRGILLLKDLILLELPIIKLNCHQENLWSCSI